MTQSLCFRVWRSFWAAQFLGGAALQRCDYSLNFAAALAAEVEQIQV